MDVTCNRCGIVYEFEEALISTTGMTVKCTQCGHLFKVHRPAPVTPLPPAELAIEPSRWRVRRIDGSTHTLDSLADLTNLIGAGQFTGDDEISRTGHLWKKLGDVAELTSLFERPQRMRRMSEPPPEPQLERKPADAKRITLSEWPGREPRKRTLTDSRFQVMGAEVAIDPPEPRRPTASDEPSVADSLTTAPHAALAALASGTGLETPPAPITPQPLQPAAGASAAVERETDPYETDAALRLRRRRKQRNVLMALAIGASAIAALLAVGLFLRARPDTEHAADPAQALVMRGDAALAAHRLERFEEAIGLYSQAQPYHPDDAHILSSLSRTHAVWSDWLRWRLNTLRTTEAAAPEQTAKLESEIKRLTAQAKQYGERAAQRNPGNEEASVALSDALRLAGNLVAARAELDRARATEGVSSAETLRVAAMLTIDEAGSDERAGRRFAEQAVAQDPALIRTRFLLARCLLSDNDPDGADLHLAAIRKLDSSHPLLAEMAAVIARARAHPSSAAHEKPAAPSSAGMAQPEVAVAQAQAPARPEAAPAGRATSAASAESADDSADPLELVRRGEAALERGAVPAAQHAFERALELDPRMARAKTGLGYVALEHNQANVAVAYFRPAAHRDNPDALIGLGDAYRKLGRARDALEAYQAYLHRYPKGDRRSIAQHQSDLLSEQLGDSP